MVQGTVNGYGERCGNANLIPIAANLQLKMGYRCLPEESLRQLTPLSRWVAELANLSPREEAPFVGRNAFAHKAGLHVSALLKHPSLYEHVPPEQVGNERRVVVSELSGRSNLQYVFGQDLEPEEARELLERVKALEHQGYQFEGAEASLELLLRDRRTGNRRAFHLESFRVTVEKREGGPATAEATVKIRVGDQVVHTAGEGNGPVNALDQALRKALRQCFPELDRMFLTDYKVRVLEVDAGTGARVRVLVETSDGERTWGPVGVSTNIIEASWQALADSVEYFLQQRAAVRAGT
jgi:2-isopropylmalate synthase